MTSTQVQSLLSGVSCFVCLGLTQDQLIYLAALQQWLLAVKPDADTSYGHLLEVASCFRCFGGNIFDMLELAMLYEIHSA